MYQKFKKKPKTLFALSCFMTFLEYEDSEKCTDETGGTNNLKFSN